MKVGVIGLGNMGAPIAENILQAGYDLVVYNRTSSKAVPLVDKGAIQALSPFEVAASTDVVFTVLAGDQATEQVVFGEEGILRGLPKGGIHVAVSTISVDCAKKINQAHSESGQHFISTTVLGRLDVAQTGNLHLIVAGPEEEREKIKPVLDVIGQDVFVMGEDPYLANVAKLGNNFLLVSMLEALSEAFLFVQKNNIEPQVFLNVINAFFDSPIYNNYGDIMVNENFEPAGFKMSLGLKDTNLALSAAEEAKASLPIAELAKKHFSKGIENGLEDLDWAALIKCIE